MKSELAVRLDGIQAALRLVLTAHGFRMRGRSFNRTTSDELTQVVDIQMGRFEPPGHVEVPGFKRSLYRTFTLNLGVYIPEAAEASGTAAKGFVRESSCAIRSRIGTLVPDRRDRWWNIDGDDASLVDDLRDHLQCHGLPFLATFDTRDAVLRECRSAGYDYPAFFPVREWSARRSLCGSDAQTKPSRSWSITSR